jgi:hypothetical protein
MEQDAQLCPLRKNEKVGFVELVFIGGNENLGFLLLRRYLSLRRYRTEKSGNGFSVCSMSERVDEPAQSLVPEL